jgi:hypothetical protein
MLIGEIILVGDRKGDSHWRGVAHRRGDAHRR